jgi:hypothetical protein
VVSGESDRVRGGRIGHAGRHLPDRDLEVHLRAAVAALVLALDLDDDVGAVPLGYRVDDPARDPHPLPNAEAGPAEVRVQKALYLTLGEHHPGRGSG